jgi:hypothetical protein
MVSAELFATVIPMLGWLGCVASAPIITNPKSNVFVLILVAAKAGEPVTIVR